MKKKLTCSFVLTGAIFSLCSEQSMTEENRFLRQSEDHFNRMSEQDQNMIETDEKMWQEGYDPNELDNKNGRQTTHPKDINHFYKNQAQWIRGEVNEDS